MSQKQFYFHRRCYLLLGTLSLLFGGVIYTWSILKNPLAAEFGWTPTQLALNHTLTMVFIAVGNLLAGALSKKTSPRILMLFSAALLFFGFFFASQMNGASILPLYLFNACFSGIGVGTFLITVVSTVGTWFPDKKGTSNSTLQMGFGLGGIVLGYAAGGMIDLSSFGWRKTFLFLAVSIGSMMLFAALILKPAPVSAKPYLVSLAGHAQKNGPSDLSASINSKLYNCSTGVMLQTTFFWRYYLFNLLVTTIGTVMINFTTDYFAELGSTASFAILMVGIVSVFNSLGRFLIGVIFDKIGSRHTILIIGICAIASPALLLLSLAAHNLIFGVLGCCLAGFSYGSIPSAASPIIRTIYGGKNFAANLSITLTNSMPAAFMATIAGAIITAGGSYFQIFLILQVLALLAFSIGFSLKQPSRTK